MKITNNPFTLIAIPREGDQLGDFLDRYAQVICERVLRSLDLTSDERQSLISDEFELSQQFNKGAWIYDDGNPEDFCNLGFGLLNLAEVEAAHLKAHILGLGFSGLFHIFERQVIMVLKRLDFRRRGDVWGSVPKNKRHTFSGYKDALKYGGYPISGDVHTKVELLRLVANIMKHGSASSLQSLHKKFPQMFWPGGDILSIDMIRLTPELLLESANVVAKYWREFPHA
ncbi:hypothetical protein JK191_12865 [Gluconobacter sphaericus]|uniref:hypothetical protein n=1 Tax=Gluconobacter sphaericus TaxID=574987 RepID=UPI001B8CCF60|nr:hypothetical protein [Gluconobacter sphaericus]MBS1098425.1 hypothetical protein [Gluconobacter sphaericus]